MKRKAILTFKVLPIFLLALLILSSLLISGCSPLDIIFGPSLGSICVDTYPSGAKIFLNDDDTGETTPCTITNLFKGTYEVKVTFENSSYTETVIVYPGCDTNVYKDLLPRLEKIIIKPDSLYTKIGETRDFSSITAYYFDIDHRPAEIKLSDCSYVKDNGHAIINSEEGTFTGVSKGLTKVIVSYTEREFTKSDLVDIFVSIFIPPPVVNPIVYRALLVGVGDYVNLSPAPDGDLEGPPYDVNRMSQVLEQCKFGSLDTEFSSIVKLKDLSATKTAILNGISSTFSGADDNDISYFYFSGHGSGPDIPEDTSPSYICPTDTTDTLDTSSMISINELETELSKIPGTKVVFLDSCNSGGFIGKGKEKVTFSKENLESFNDEIINIFSQAQSKGLLTTNQYKVLTSCHYYQSCSEWSPHPLDGNPFGWFSATLCEGCGYNSFSSPYPADINENNKISLQEAYLYVESILELLEQDVQVYPSDSDFTIVEY